MLDNEKSRKTIIHFDESEKTASVLTCSRRIISQLLDSCKKFPELYQLTAELGESKSFTVPKKYVCVRQPPPKTSNISLTIQGNREGESVG